MQTLSVLVPTYLSGIPQDPTGEAYKVGINPNNNTISVWSDTAEQVSVAIGVNIFSPVSVVAAGAKDPSFDTGILVGFDTVVWKLALQTDGKIILGGNFTAYRGVGSNRIIRLNSDMSIDTSFNIGTGFDGGVTSLAIQSDGKILVGGSFSSYQGVSANRIIRLNSDGSRDTSFNIGTGLGGGSLFYVNTFAVQSDGKILLGGYFTSYQGVSANYIIRLNSDGSRDSSFNLGTGFNGEVRTITVQSDSKIIVGGEFTTYQGASANRIIRLNSDGSRDTSFNIGTGFNVTMYQGVRAISLQTDGKIIVGGEFTTYQGVSANRIIRLNSDGSRDSSFNLGTGFFGEVYTLIIQPDGKIVVGGVFTTYQGIAANRIIRLNSDGSRDSSFNLGTGFNNTVISLASQSDGKIIVGGFFTTYKGVGSNRIIRLNNDGNIDASFNVGEGFNSTVNTLAVQSDGKIFVGGEFTSYQNQPAGYLIRIGN